MQGHLAVIGRVVPGRDIVPVFCHDRIAERCLGAANPVSAARAADRIADILVKLDEMLKCNFAISKEAKANPAR